MKIIFFVPPSACSLVDLILPLPPLLICFSIFCSPPHIFTSYSLPHNALLKYVRGRERESEREKENVDSSMTPDTLHKQLPIKRPPSQHLHPHCVWHTRTHMHAHTHTHTPVSLYFYSLTPTVTLVFASPLSHYPTPLLSSPPSPPRPLPLSHPSC